ncbi:hypothetical protein [Nonomuraea aurantiaca]|uniref:hypothetical protein n=1 Tax=Nonomuraea aurantiaca TaxID=2878562 RepID=UPI001CD9B25D|nr:hypothetical protein [Nonomuraea aurantiaca]MCA2226362.1 hypothetical protein [Nonomuraea aurantiaca]
MDATPSAKVEVTVRDWAEGARTVREAFAALGLTLPACLPGEPEDCGHGDARDHYASYLGALQGHVESLIEASFAGDSDALDEVYRARARHRAIMDDVLG